MSDRPPGARSRVFRLLAARAASFPEIAEPVLDDAGLDPRDAALAHTIVDHVSRFWLTLEFLLDLYAKAPMAKLEPAVRGVLLGGAAQLVYLDRVPPHAVIDTAVEWAKREIRPGAGGLVNAVLRRVGELVSAGARRTRGTWTDTRDELPLPDGRALVLNSPVLPDAPTERLAVATSHPRGLLSAWVARFGADRARALARHSVADPPVVLNIAHAKTWPPHDAPAAESFSPHSESGCAVAHDPGGWLGVFLRAHHDVWVQDAASTLAIKSVADLGPRAIADLCAGQGTKTRQLAATFPQARIFATDPDAARFRVLVQSASACDQVSVAPPREVRRVLRQSAAEGADLILLDVPCSNTGVLARRPEAKYRAGPEQLARLTALQRHIIADAVPLLAPRGAILYSTCSIDRDENEAIVEWATRAFGLRVTRARMTFPGGDPGGPPASYHDGGFSALLHPRSPAS